LVDSRTDAPVPGRVSEAPRFDAEWYVATYPDVAKSSLSPEDHYLNIGAFLRRKPNPGFDVEDYLRTHPELLAGNENPYLHFVLNPAPLPEEPPESEEPAEPAMPTRQGLEVDEAYYLLVNPDVAAAGMDAADHFHSHGHLELRNPRADFDLWWYSQKYLIGTPDEGTDPLLHFNATGRENGYLTRPPMPVAFDPAYSRPLPDNPRRICLFAAYDPHGLVDDSVLHYLRDLSLHADIYYLADCQMEPSEMAKLDGIVAGAWAERHGTYDFGSYSRLAGELVGWETIAQYDEMILANDSCWLVHPLEETFREMAARPCAWWGLQATKGLYSTMHQNHLPEGEPVPLSTIKRDHLSAFEGDRVYDFLVGSYFMGFRRDVINDPDFRRLLNNVSAEVNKLLIIRKYEIGLTRYLIGCGFEFDTLVDGVSKKHPIFTERAFDLIDEGFPLLKRYFLSQNHYKVPGLTRWKSRILHANPDADVDAFERNLYRVGDAKRLHDNFRTAENPQLSPAPRSRKAMAAEDLKTPKYDHWWAFPVCYYSHLFSDNTRAVFERVKNDPGIKKIILTRSIHVEPDGVNTVVAPLHSHEGQTYLLRSRQVFLRHSVRSNVDYPLSSKLHNFHNLWHGIPLKRIGYASLDLADKLADVVAETKRLKSVIASSDVDRLAMAAAYWPLTYHDIWVTGLPRHDFILENEDRLPADFIAKGRRLGELLQGRKFVLFVPTFRKDQEDGYYAFSEEEVNRLSDWLNRNDMVMGIREHMADTKKLYSSRLKGDRFVDVSGARFPDVELLYRHADLLVTDYSSCFIDFMLLGRPMISFAFDQDSYVNDQRGMFYDHALAFPGPICRDFPEFMQALEDTLAPVSDAQRLSYDLKTSLFHNYRDTHNADRVVEKVKETYEGSRHPLVEEDLRPSVIGRNVVFVFSPKDRTTDRYRLHTTIGHLKGAGWSYKAFGVDTLTLDDLKETGLVVLSRVPLNGTLVDVCEAFRARGGRIVLDLDEPIHDMEVFSQSEAFHDRPDSSNDFAILSAQTRRVIETVDAVTVPTDSLADSLAEFGKPVHVVPDSISEAMSVKYRTRGATASPPTGLRLCYVSGTGIHSANFAQCRDALRTVLRRHPDVELHIVGGTGTDGGDSDGEDPKAVHHAPMTYEARHEFLADMHVNLAPLAPTRFNDCKSESSLFEAALHGVPSVASPTATHAQAIRNGEDGLLARTRTEWEEALEWLISSPGERERLGTAAFLQIAPRFRASRSAEKLIAVLEGLMAEDRAAFYE